MEKIEELLNRGVENVYPSREALEKVLKSGKKLKLYQGFDPSMPSLHLGNLVGMMKLRQFQKLGHQVIFLVGDFTGMIGDPTDKLATRKKLTREQVTENAAKWKEQAGRILDFSGNNPVTIMFNSKWLDKLTFRDIIELSSNFTVQQMIERDMFQIRLKDDKPIHLHEFLYPIAVSIDCVEMDVDLEIGGSDQTFNMLAGRTLMKAIKNKEKFVLTTKLLVDKDGNKVGKTTGNALFLDSTPEKFYGGIMSFPDEVLLLGFELLTEKPIDDDVKTAVKKEPMKAKKMLAYEIVQMLWGKTAADKAQSEFENTFQKRIDPGTAPTKKTHEEEMTVFNILKSVDATITGSEIRRMVVAGAIEINGNKVTDPFMKIQLSDENTIKKGKFTFYKLIKK